MTYSVQSVANLNDVVAEIVTFAAAHGWTTTAGSITNPVTGVETSLTVSAEYLTLQPTGGPPSRFRSPRLNGTYPSSPVVINPTQVHLFANPSPYAPKPYLAAIVAFGFNDYRHIYIGTLVPAGNYTNGDVVTCNDFSQSYVDLFQVNARSRYLFNAYQAHVDATTHAGGARITHASNAVEWRKFRVPGVSTLFLSSNYAALDGTDVFGGNGDGINDGMAHRAKASFASGRIMVPVNLFCSNGANGANYRIRPLGYVAGVRLVNMEGIAPEQQLQISSDNWRAFPEFSKRSDPFLDWSELGTTKFWPYEFSGYFGLAYRENA